MNYLLPKLNSTDEDVKYLLKHRDELQFSIVVYLDKTPDEIRSMLINHPDFFTSNTYTHDYKKPNFWEKYILKQNQRSPKITITDSLISQSFEGGKLETEILKPDFFTDVNPAFLRIFGIDIGGDGENTFELPQKNKLLFLPKSLLFNDYLPQNEALKLITFYQANRYILNQLNLNYFGFVNLEGTDYPKLDEVLEQLNNKYSLFNCEDNYSRPFMSKIHNDQQLESLMFRLENSK